MHILIVAISRFANILMMILFARAICSWFVRGRDSGVYRIYQILVNLTEPIVAPCRRLTERFNTGFLDISVFLAIFLIMIVRDVIIWILLRI